MILYFYLSFFATIHHQFDAVPYRGEWGIRNDYGISKGVTFPLDYNSDIQKYIEYYSTRGKRSFEVILGRGARYRAFIEASLIKSGLVTELFLLPVIESGFNQKALSSMKAGGLWQLMPFTATSLGLKVDPFIDERRNFKKSTLQAIQFLKMLHDRYDNWYLMLAAYNCGPGCVDRRIEKGGSSDFWEIQGDFPKETQGYVPRFIAVLYLMKYQYDFDINPVVAEGLEEQFSVVLPHAVPISLLARASGLSFEQIQRYNPEMVALITPPHIKDYTLYLPISVQERFEKNFKELKKEMGKGFIFHRLKGGETLSHVAIDYGTSVKEIKLANRIRNVRRLRAGARLLIPIDPKGYSKRIGARGFPTPPQKNRVIYKVRRGDTYWGIARSYNITPGDLKQWNPKIDNRRLYVGQNLNLYIQKFTKSIYLPRHKRPHLIKYKLKSGESLWTLSKRFKVPINELKRTNQLSNSRKLQIGQVIKLYSKYKIN